MRSDMENVLPMMHICPAMRRVSSLGVVKLQSNLVFILFIAYEHLIDRRFLGQHSSTSEAPLQSLGSLKTAPFFPESNCLSVACMVFIKQVFAFFVFLVFSFSFPFLFQLPFLICPALFPFPLHPFCSELVYPLYGSQLTSVSPFLRPSTAFCYRETAPIPPALSRLNSQKRRPAEGKKGSAH